MVLDGFAFSAVEAVTVEPVTDVRKATLESALGCHARLMGFFSRLFGARTAARPQPEVHVTATVRYGLATPLARLAGTTTTRKDEARAMMTRHGQAEDGYLEVQARLVEEWVEKIQAHAIAVVVEGEPIGYLDTPTTKHTDVQSFDTVAVQAFSEQTGKGLRVEAWVWLSPDRPRWDWSRSKRPPMTLATRSQARHHDINDRLRARSEAGGEAARNVERGTVNGVHYLQLIEPIKQAKREGRLEYALSMCYAAIEGAERDRAGGVPAPAYTEHAAIVLRKLGRRSEEVEVLERYLAFVPGSKRASHPFTERARKAREASVGL